MFVPLLHTFRKTVLCPAENDNEWMNNKYATAVLAEQQNNYTMTSYDCDRTLFSQHDSNCLQHHVYQERQTFIPVHNEVPPSSIGYIDNRITANVSFIEFTRFNLKLCDILGGS